MTDEEWLQEVRGRVARGEDWEGPLDQAPFAVPVLPRPADVTVLTCPYCTERQALEIFRRYEVASLEPLLHCPRCYGFWAKGDALAHGVADVRDEHRALYARPAAARCRACAGRLDENETCRQCGTKLPRLNCPACGLVMDRGTLRKVTVDTCHPCKGVWFDVGELAVAFGLEPPQSMAMAMVDEHAMDGEPEGWQLALSTALNIFLRFV